MVIYGRDGNELAEVAYGTQGFESLAGVSTTGAGAVLNGGAARSNHALVVNGSGTATVVLQGSLDGFTWWTLATASFTGSVVSVNGSGQPVQYLRANVTAISGTISAAVASA